MHFGYRKEIGWAHFETTQSRSIARRRGTFHCHHAASIRHRHSSLEESRRGLSPAPVVSRFRDSQSKRPPKSHISITEYPWHWRVDQYGASACGSAVANIQFASEAVKEGGPVSQKRANSHQSIAGGSAVTKGAV